MPGQMSRNACRRTRRSRRADRREPTHASCKVKTKSPRTTNLGARKTKRDDDIAMMRGVVSVALIALWACVVSAEDYYKVLGVERNADDQVCPVHL